MYINIISIEDNKKHNSFPKSVYFEFNFYICLLRFVRQSKIKVSTFLL